MKGKMKKILMLLCVVSLVAGMIVPTTASPRNGQGGPGGADDGQGDGQVIGHGVIGHNGPDNIGQGNGQDAGNKGGTFKKINM